jgi:hypothetical protein
MALLLAPKACDGPLLSSSESHHALNLGGAYEGIVTYIEALKAFDMF